MFKGPFPASAITRPAFDEAHRPRGKTAVAMLSGNCGNCANLEKARGTGIKRVGACSARSCGNCGNASAARGAGRKGQKGRKSVQAQKTEVFEESSSWPKSGRNGQKVFWRFGDLSQRWLPSTAAPA